MYTLKMNTYTLVQAASLALRTDKNHVAVGKVDLVFCLLYGTVHFGLSPRIHIFFKKKKIPHANCRKIFLEVGSEK